MSAFCILHSELLGSSSDGSPLLHQTDRRHRDQRRAGELRYSRERDHPLRAGRRHHARHRDDEAERVHAVRVWLRVERAHDDGGRRRRAKWKGGSRSHPRGQEARRHRRASGEPWRVVRARSGSDSGDVSPGSHHAAAEAKWRSRPRQVRRHLLGRCDGGTRVAPRRARDGGEPEVAGVSDATPSWPSCRARRSIPRSVRRARPDRLRAVQRRCAAACERAQLRT